MKKMNTKEMYEINGGSLTLLVLGWTAVNVAVYGGAYALCYHYNKARK